MLSKIEVKSTAEITLGRDTVFRYGSIEFLTDRDELISGTKRIPLTAKRAEQIELIRKGAILVVETTVPNLESSAKALSMSSGSNRENEESPKKEF